MEGDSEQNMQLNNNINTIPYHIDSIHSLSGKFLNCFANSQISKSILNQIVQYSKYVFPSLHSVHALDHSRYKFHSSGMTSGATVM